MSAVEVEKGTYRDGRLCCVAKLTGDPCIDAVQLCYVTTDEPKYLRSVFFMDTPAENFVRAQWRSSPMRREGDHWAADLEMLAPAGRFVACFVDVATTAGRTRGWACSPTLWLQDAADQQTSGIPRKG